MSAPVLYAGVEPALIFLTAPLSLGESGCSIAAAAMNCWWILLPKSSKSAVWVFLFLRHPYRCWYGIAGAFSHKKNVTFLLYLLRLIMELLSVFSPWTFCSRSSLVSQLPFKTPRSVVLLAISSPTLSSPDGSPVDITMPHVALYLKTGEIGTVAFFQPK